MFYISSSHLGLYNSYVYHGSYLTGSFETNLLDKNSFWASWVKTWAPVGNRRFKIYSNIFIFDKNELFVHSSQYTEGNSKKMSVTIDFTSSKSSVEKTRSHDNISQSHPIK